MLKAILLIIIISAGVSVWYARSLTYAECIPINGMWIEPSDYTYKKKIAAALRNISRNSPEDYERICERAKHIQLKSIRNYGQYDTASKDIYGTYESRNDAPKSSGVIGVDRKVAGGGTDRLEETLVHEACHAYQIQEFNDYSEPPCLQRGQDYLKSQRK